MCGFSRRFNKIYLHIHTWGIDHIHKVPSNVLFSHYFYLRRKLHFETTSSVQKDTHFCCCCWGAFGVMFSYA